MFFRTARNDSQNLRDLQVLTIASTKLANGASFVDEGGRPAPTTLGAGRLLS